MFIRFWDDLGDLYGFRDQPRPKKLSPLADLLSPNFRLVRMSKDDAWAYIEHTPTRETKWVLGTHIRIHGISQAFYDAEVTFLPDCEKK